MAVLNQVLGSPESGWTRYNDNNTSLTYESLNYIYLTEAMNVYQSDIHVLRDVGDKVKFNISGTGFRIISSTYPGQAEVKVLIDGIESGTYTSNKSQGNLILLYEKKGLENKEHAVVLEKTSGGDFIFDALDVQGELKEYKLPPVNKYLFKDGEEIKKYVLVKDNIPTMTSNTKPYGIASAVREHSSDMGAWRAFDDYSLADGNDNGKGWLDSGFNGSSWLEYDFGVEKIITKYTIDPQDQGANETIPSRAPVDWTFEGYNSSTASWDILDTKIGVVDWSRGARKEFTITNTVAYSRYRINITKNNGGGSYLAIGEIQMMEEGGFKMVGNNPATKTMFDEHGITDLSVIDIKFFQQLQSDQVELLCWTDEEQQMENEINLVPVLTHASSALPIFVSSSNSLSGNYEWKSFDGNESTTWSTNYNTGEQWIKVDFGLIKKVTSYYINTVNSGSAPLNFTFEGSNDNQIWNVLDAKNVSKYFWTNPAQTFKLNSVGEYRYYRIKSINAGNPSLAIKEFQLKEKVEEKKISRVSSLKTVTNPQLLIAGVDVAVNSVEHIAISIAIEGLANSSVVSSPDSGTTWMGKTQVDITDLTSVKANGFTPEELNALTKEEIATLFPNGTARFAFYLEQENLTDVVEIQSLSIGEKQYTISPTATDLSLIYEVLQKEKPTLYASRDDGVSWKEISQDEMASLSEQPEGKSLRVKAVLKNGQEIHALSYAWV